MQCQNREVNFCLDFWLQQISKNVVVSCQLAQSPYSQPYSQYKMPQHGRLLHPDNCQKQTKKLESNTFKKGKLISKTKPQIRRLKMRLGQMDPRLACSGPMSTFSYDSHPVSRFVKTFYHIFQKSSFKKNQTALYIIK